MRNCALGRDDTECVISPLYHASLRAQRSNPESFRGGILDCFAALAMTEKCARRRRPTPPLPASARRSRTCAGIRPSGPSARRAASDCLIA
ncbi:hypothetical protein CWO91_08710 [Bradyrhizobium genosp. SA-3]|nr:hypothetical protein CWO91_08710 [Bradyrhizobium genosp. SA-3]